MKREVYNSDKVPAGRARISHAAAAGDLVFVSGMVGRQAGATPGSATVPAGTAAQTRATLENLKAVLEASGSSLQHVLKTNCFLTNMDNFNDFNTVWESYFPKDPPARFCVQARLGPGFEVEIDAVAVKR